MQFRIFRISGSGDAEAEMSLNQFLRAHRVVSVIKELVQIPEGASWHFCVEYLFESETQNEKHTFGKKQGRVDYKELLSDADFAVYAKLRELRKEISQRDGVPVYAIATNEHLSQMAQKRSKTLEDLKKIAGFGDAKISKYGTPFLEVITELEEKETGKECTVPEQIASTCRKLWSLCCCLWDRLAKPSCSSWLITT